MGTGRWGGRASPHAGDGGPGSGRPKGLGSNQMGHREREKTEPSRVGETQSGLQKERLGFKSNSRNPERMAHGNARKFIPSREQH